MVNSPCQVALDLIRAVSQVRSGNQWLIISSRAYFPCGLWFDSKTRGDVIHYARKRFCKFNELHFRYLLQFSDLTFQQEATRWRTRCHRFLRCWDFRLKDLWIWPARSFSLGGARCRLWVNILNESRIAWKLETTLCRWWIGDEINHTYLDIWFNRSLYRGRGRRWARKKEELDDLEEKKRTRDEAILYFKLHEFGYTSFIIYTFLNFLWCQQST